jgi:ascorbate-specific PTS system EIIC-type component UlaA
MYRDDLEFEERWLFLTKYMPSVVMFACLWAVGAPLIAALAVALLFALLGWLAIYKHVRGTIAIITVAMTLAWLIAPAGTKQSIRDLVNEARYSPGHQTASPT